MPDIVMPRLSDSMEEGTIIAWIKDDGDTVLAGEDLVEIETDKATMTYAAEVTGVLTIVVKPGESVLIGAPIAKVLGDGEAAVPLKSRQSTAAPGSPPVAAGGPKTTAAAPVNGRKAASPVARRMARQLNLELAAIAGSGPGGRVVKADVVAVANASEATVHAPTQEDAAAAASQPEPLPPPYSSVAIATATGETPRRELTRLQRTVARRMSESKATVPDFVLTVEADMTEAVALRNELKRVGSDGQRVPSFNDLVIRAAGLALRDFPLANASYKDGFELHSRVNVGMAVAAQDALVVATIFDADQKALGQIAAETRALAERVRAGIATPAELSGATFTVSNLGMFGIRRFVAIINPPQAAILAVGEMVEAPVVRDGEILVRTIMELTLSCDHRILYGADAAQFLGAIRRRIESPLALAL